MDIVEALKQRIELERRRGMEHKPPPAKPSPEDAAAVSAAMSLVSPFMGGIVSGVAESANEGKSPLAALGDAFIPTKAGPAKLDMFKRVSDAAYKKILPQAVDALDTKARGKPEYYSRKTQEFHGDTGFSLWPSGKPDKPLILTEIDYKLRDLPPPTRTYSTGTELYKGDADKILNIPELYDEFPQLRQAQIKGVVNPKVKDTEGWWLGHGANVNAGSRTKLLEGLVHEVGNHGVQELNQLPLGSSPRFMDLQIDLLQRLGLVRALDQGEKDYLARYLYSMHTGEQLATAGEKRAHLTPWERLSTHPMESTAVKGKILDPSGYISRYQRGQVTQEELAQILEAIRLRDRNNPHKNPASLPGDLGSVLQTTP